jgi:hypothetical protein
MRRRCGGRGEHPAVVVDRWSASMARAPTLQPSDHDRPSPAAGFRSRRADAPLRQFIPKGRFVDYVCARDRGTLMQRARSHSPSAFAARPAAASRWRRSRAVL